MPFHSDQTKYIYDVNGDLIPYSDIQVIIGQTAYWSHDGTLYHIVLNPDMSHIPETAGVVDIWDKTPDIGRITQKVYSILNALERSASR